MAMNKQVLAVALCFLLYCLLHLTTSDCSSSEERYYTVGMDTFLIEEEMDFNASRSPLEVLASQEKGRRGDTDLTISYLNPSSGSSWRDRLLQGLEREKHLLNGILSNAGKNKSGSSTRRSAAFNIPVTSGSETKGPEYTVTVGIGISALKQLMGIDTLTSLSWIECQPCKGCSLKVEFPMYVPKQSSSFKPVLCKTSKCPPLGSDPKEFHSECDKWGVCTYADINGVAQGSEGDYITETLRLGRQTFKDFHMGCAYGFSQDRQDGTSGRLGLGRGPLSLASQKYRGQFSYCLPNYLSVRATGSLRFGKGSIPSSVKRFTPMQRNADFFSSAYLLGLEGISVGGQRLRVSMQVPGALPTITYIDTALMATRLVRPVYQALTDSFEQKMKTFAPGVKAARPFGDFRPCYRLSSIKSVKIPIVTLHFKGNANVDVPKVGTLLQIDENRVCFPFLPSDRDSVNIIGNVQQQGLRVAFDNVNNRVGFSNEQC